jgi:hypothetical protein
MGFRYSIRCREYVCKSIRANRPQRFAVLGNEFRCEIYRCDNSNLLAEYRANGDFEAVPGAWHAQTRAFRDEWREQRVSAEVIPDGQRIRAKIKNAPDAPNDTCECAHLRKADRYP